MPPRRGRRRSRCGRGTLRRDGGRARPRARGASGGRVGADGGPALRGPELGGRGRLSRRGRSTLPCSPRCGRASRTSTSGSTASGTGPARRSRSGRCASPRSVRLPQPARSTSTARTLRLRAAAPAAGSTSAATSSTRRCARERRSERSPSRARCSSTSTTPPFSSRPAGRPDATRPPERSCWNEAIDGG